MIDEMDKASILVEALPYIKKFYGEIVVIKYGGHAMVNDELKKAVLTDVVLMKYVGMNPVIVHGGGPEITNMLKRVGIESNFVGGLRVTDQMTMEIAEMVLVGKVNKEIVALVNQFGGKAVGLSGKDANLFEVVKKNGTLRQPDGSTQKVDIGFVGDISKVNPELVKTLLKEGYIPIISPVSADEKGESYNINADEAAGALCSALKADKFINLTNVPGIMTNPSDNSSLLSVVDENEVKRLIAKGIINGGMIPKVECCLNALQGGVKAVHIVDGRVPHSILLEIFTNKGVGTMVVKEKGIK